MNTVEAATAMLAAAIALPVVVLAYAVFIVWLFDKIRRIQLYKDLSK